MDRWVLSKSAGLRIGTSLNSLGERESEISSLRKEEFDRIRRSIERYQVKEKWDSDGNRISYASFDLLV